MPRFADTALAALAALVLSLGSIGAIVTIPPAQAAGTGFSPVTTELA
jgi:hypothetical protein